MAGAPEGDAEATRRHKELVEYVKANVAREHGLSESQGKRLVGGTLGELRADAKVMARELGLDVDDEGDGRARDEHGRFAGNTAVNRAIRQAAGR